MTLLCIKFRTLLIYNCYFILLCHFQHNVNASSVVNGFKNSTHIIYKRITPLIDKNVNKLARVIINYNNHLGKKLIRNYANKIYHEFDNDGYMAVDINKTSLKILMNDINIIDIENDSIWKIQSKVDYITSFDKIIEFKDININDYLNFTNNNNNNTNNKKNKRNYNQNNKRNFERNSLLVGSVLTRTEVIPYGIKMIQADKIKYKIRKKKKKKPFICIVDSGVGITHIDINSKLEGTSRYVPATKQTLYWNKDINGHGTHIVGTIVAKQNNNYGIPGIDTNIPIYIVRGVDNEGNTRESDIIQAIGHCMNSGKNIRIINLSLSGNVMSNTFKTLLDKLYSKNILIVAAAGNNGNNIKQYPASYNKVISVGAVNSNETRWKLSNYNDNIELVAPGQSILSTYINWKGENSFASISGTSQAAPHVSAVASILWSHFPYCTNTQIRYVLARTAKDKGSYKCDQYYGYGIIQLESAYNFIKKYKCKGATWGKYIGDGSCSVF